MKYLSLFTYQFSLTKKAQITKNKTCYGGPMKMRKIPFAAFYIFLCLHLLAMTSQASHVVEETARSDYFFLPAGSVNVSSITERDYLEMIWDFQAQFQTAVYSKTRKAVIFSNDWQSPYFGASALRHDAYFQVSLLAGTVRVPEFNKAMMAAVLCHELGHILGGEPLQTVPLSEWASTEGQSDFYAARDCLPKFFQRHPEMMNLSAVDSKIKKRCKGNESCERTAQVGWELINVFQKYSFKTFKPVSLIEHEKPTLELIRNSYPSDQCRVDTYLQGALCQLGRSCDAPACWAPPKQ